MAAPIVYLKDLAKCEQWLYELADNVDKRKRPQNASMDDKLDQGNNWLSTREQQRLEHDIREYFSFKNPNSSDKEIDEKVTEAMDEVYSHVPGWQGFKQRVRYAAGTLFPVFFDKFQSVSSK